MPNNTHYPSLERLFEQVTRHDDYQAFEKIFKSTYGDLLRYIMGFTSDKGEAENVVSEVFYKLWKHRGSIHISTSVKSYLYSATRNQALDGLRKTQSAQVMMKKTSSALSAHVISPEEKLIGQELEECIQNAINQLPEQRQLIFRLNREEGLKYREIAQRLNISIKTVETQMSRSLKALREAIPH
ncbi:RNA polymerase sigma-70 factor [Tunicatimonas pelagia]|uniref:RNA polymerase sigma-70 factor n=1 Tax=Tunicatimonas pelagia TaxID=931531 RepID=UPI002664F126|nr:RNA polymerase sigma-70 factor [Tunicatimonas pelagia]WKN45619.1 RNA polymerase sigma-70 factor [Tunicatimonas pelagia]